VTDSTETHAGRLREVFQPTIWAGRHGARPDEARLQPMAASLYRRTGDLATGRRQIGQWAQQIRTPELNFAAVAVDPLFTDRDPVSKWDLSSVYA